MRVLKQHLCLVRCILNEDDYSHIDLGIVVPQETFHHYIENKRNILNETGKVLFLKA